MKVLIAETDTTLRETLAATFIGWGYQVALAETAEEILTHFRAADPPHALLIGTQLPDGDPAELCNHLPESEASRHAYIIQVVPAGADLATAVATGADDFVVAPASDTVLRLRLRTAGRVARLEAETGRLHKVLREQVSRDPLTAVMTRTAVIDTLKREVARSRREGCPVGVLMVDIDHFKKVNDEHGHLIGDAVLRNVARCMRDAVRQYDAVGRYGGEEFLVVLPGADHEAAVGVAVRMRNDLELLETRELGSHVKVTASFGVDSCVAGGQTSAEDLIRSADARLLQAKREGRNRVVSAERPPEPEAPPAPPASATFLREVSRGDKAKLGDMVREFESGARAHADKIRAGIGDGDHAQVRSGVYGLCGLCVTVAATSLARHTRQMMGMDPVEHARAAESLLDEIDVEIDRVVDHLELETGTLE